MGHVLSAHAHNRPSMTGNGRQQTGELQFLYLTHQGPTKDCVQIHQTPFPSLGGVWGQDYYCCCMLCRCRVLNTRSVQMLLVGYVLYGALVYCMLVIWPAVLSVA